MAFVFMVTVNNAEVETINYVDSEGDWGLVKKVESEDKKSEDRPADFYLTGKLKKLFGKQEYTSGPLTGAVLFGLMGVIATSGITTPTEIEIEITDLAIYKNDGQLLAEIGNIHEKFDWETTGGGECMNVFLHVNAKLKPLIDKLAREIENALANHVSR